jgi:excisionase family DNA binding protein
MFFESRLEIDLSRVTRNLLSDRMSSNIKLIKECEFCHNAFTAKTTVTRYCSHRCNQKHYKELKREAKVRAIVQPFVHKKAQVFLRKDFLSIPDAARLAGVSERTIFRMISRRLINPVRQGRKVSIKLNDLLKYKTYENLY